MPALQLCAGGFCSPLGWQAVWVWKPQAVEQRNLAARYLYET